MAPSTVREEFSVLRTSTTLASEVFRTLAKAWHRQFQCCLLFPDAFVATLPSR